MPSNDLLRNICEDLLHIQVRKSMYTDLYKGMHIYVNHLHCIIVHNYEVFVSFLFFCLPLYLCLPVSLFVSVRLSVIETDIFCP